jgi:hypothetical protein
MASFQLDLPTDMQTVMAEREGKQLANQREKSIIDLARPREEAEIGQMNAAADLNRAYADRSRKLLPSEAVLKEVEAEKATAELGEWYKDAGNREISRNIANVYGKDELEWATNDPEGYRKIRNAEAFFKASQTRREDFIVAQEAEYQARDQLSQAWKDGGVDGARAAMGFINDRYKGATGKDYFTQEMPPLDITVMGSLNKRRDSVLESLEHMRRMHEIEAQGDWNMRVAGAGGNNRVPPKNADHVRRIVNPELANKFGFNIDSDAQPKFAKDDPFAKDKQYVTAATHLANMANTVLLKVYEQNPTDESLVTRAAEQYSLNFMPVTYDSWSNITDRSTIIPSDLIEGTEYETPQDYLVALEKQLEGAGYTEEEIPALVEKALRKAREAKNQEIINQLQ